MSIQKCNLCPGTCVTYVVVLFCNPCPGRAPPTMFALDYFFVLAGYMAAVGRFNAECVVIDLAEVGKTTMRYLSKKLVTFYPLHLTCFFLIVALWLVAPLHAGYVPEDAKGWCFLTSANLLLLQDWSWSREIKFCFNGVSWFLSCLMFCFALTPLLLRCASVLIHKLGRRIVWGFVLFAVCIKLPLFVFESGWTLSEDFTEIFLFDAHSWPPFRLVDYALGMCAGIWWEVAPEMRSQQNVCSRVRNYVLILAAVAGLVAYDYLPQPFVLILISVGIWGLSDSSSYLSNFLRSRLLVFLGSLVMPVYLLHNVLLKLARSMCLNVKETPQAILCFTFCLLVGFCWLKTENKIRRIFARK